MDAQGLEQRQTQLRRLVCHLEEDAPRAEAAEKLVAHAHPRRVPAPQESVHGAFLDDGVEGGVSEGQ
eukprot:CAMPEP_0177747238 /NCGR_PEP_ID=MMETSP0484_2-20121128/31296_1 /TAXON_ID=354590 /ORGANISM="Rhodomonas lens, Strain RHODO" /LENGTH=66 /DNA_ID=CAMNT_0019262041 /DNA_START=134 /DNA_END=334 /DNA_ORIENTATION=-